MKTILLRTGFFAELEGDAVPFAAAPRLMERRDARADQSAASEKAPDTWRLRSSSRIARGWRFALRLHPQTAKDAGLEGLRSRSSWATTASN